MKVNINPTNIAEAVLLLHSEELLQSLEDTVFVLSHSQDTDEDEITFFYFSDGSYMSVSPDFEYQSHDMFSWSRDIHLYYFSTRTCYK